MAGSVERTIDPLREELIDIYPYWSTWRERVWNMPDIEVKLLSMMHSVAVFEMEKYVEEAAAAPPPPIPPPEGIHPNQLMLEL